MSGLRSWRRKSTGTVAVSRVPREYPDELRERALREVRTAGRPVAHVAKDLGIHKEALRGRVRQAGADRGEGDDRLTTAEQDELEELRKGSGGVEAGERDPQSRLGVFCPGDRPSPARPSR
ncbi:transposase [Streptomyces humi]|uniref:transposase n=1 Tax=Streptomyces humi TaxID=1428620 RepID=UPI003B846455